MRRTRAAALALAAAASGLAFAGAGCVPQPESDRPQPRDAGTADGFAGADGGATTAQSFSFVVLPDTQYYASTWRDVFLAQTRWVVANRDALHIGFVLHTGDIVDDDVPVQWEAATAAMHLLDGVVPYVLAAGNHDYTDLADRQGLVNQYFPVSEIAQQQWFGGTFEPDHIENSYSVIAAGGASWLVISLEFGPRDEALAWADGVLKQHPTTPAIVVTHAYLYADDQLYDHDRKAAPGQPRPPAQPFDPHDYVMMGQPGTSINDGAEMYRKLIGPNSNVKLVFCGHVVSGNDLPPGTAGRMTTVRPDGSTVHQILANYQTCLAAPCADYDGDLVHGGNGFLRVVQVSPEAGTIWVSTYSPYLDQSLTDPANQFVLLL
jgi:hypothetical protein